MFRLSKGNQSRKNHKIINQTTKVSDADAKLSTPAMQAQQHQEALMKQQAEEEAAMLESQKKLVEQTIVNPTQSEPENKNNETDKITIQIINAELKVLYSLLSLEYHIFFSKRLIHYRTWKVM